MPASTFDALFAAAGMPELLAHFGIPVLYRPRENAGQERTVTVIFHCRREGEVEEGLLQSQREEALVTCWRTRQQTAEGIDDPQEGDALLRAEDSPDAPWGFSGEIRDQSGVAWTLVFTRVRPVRYGPRPQR